MNLLTLLKDPGMKNLNFSILQKALNKMTKENIKHLIKEISTHMKDILINPFGNYFIQKLFQTIVSEQRFTILKLVRYFLLRFFPISFLFLATLSERIHCKLSLNL